MREGVTNKGYIVDDSEQYEQIPELDKSEREKIWKTAIGLQAVDQLKVSEYLLENAKKNIDGDITIDDVNENINNYYDVKNERLNEEFQCEEADKVSVNITRILGERSFLFSTLGLSNIHLNIFRGVFSHAGKFRQVNMTKAEWVLGGDTVIYSPWQDLGMTVSYDIDLEKKFKYTSLTIDQKIEHIADFVSRLWQIHPFREGNTRTIAVFTIKYLRMLGYRDIDNTLFNEHSWYFRNALVRANYRNIQKGVDINMEYLIKFFRNLILGEKNILRNRDLVIEEGLHKKKTLKH